LDNTKFDDSTLFQGLPVNVKHGARCAMGKLGEDKKSKEGEGEF